VCTQVFDLIFKEVRSNDICLFLPSGRSSLRYLICYPKFASILRVYRIYMSVFVLMIK
ncbi:unnamed protein product, partial [Schistosoma curassoni]|uniref:Ovule protein n=1 Tax=Schistosoma curassoni TaxID=6186 RepID=A0A183L7N3_9TREM